MNEEERKRMYMSLLTGLAQTAQDQLCAKDEGHDWGPWERTAHHHDIALRFKHGATATVNNQTVRISARRKCLNCGKEQMDA